MHGNLRVGRHIATATAARSGHDSQGAEVDTAQSRRAKDSTWSFMRLAQCLWPDKPGSHLHYLLDAPERTCRAWASGERNPGSDVLAQLLQSPQGNRVLDHIMRGCTQPWWLRHQLADAHLVAREAYDAALSEQLEMRLK